MLSFVLRVSQAVAVILLVATLLLPRLPPLITSTLPPPNRSTAQAFLDPIAWSSAVFVLASQLHLNHRLRTFGANYRAAAYLDLASAVLLVLPMLFSPWWGRWEQMGALGLAGIASLGGKAALAWQAWKYQRVEQLEDEEE